MAVSISQLTLSVRLCDYADCRKPLHTVLQCQVQGRRLLLQGLPGVLTTTSYLCTEQASCQRLWQASGQVHNMRAYTHFFILAQTYSNSLLRLIDW
jgi:hypothetical protein